MANNNVIKEQECTRKDGTKTTDNTLLIDLHNLKNMSLMGLAKKLLILKKKELQLGLKKNLQKNNIKSTLVGSAFCIINSAKRF